MYTRSHYNVRNNYNVHVAHITRDIAEIKNESKSNNIIV